MPLFAFSRCSALLARHIGNITVDFRHFRRQLMLFFFAAASATLLSCCQMLLPPLRRCRRYFAFADVFRFSSPLSLLRFFYMALLRATRACMSARHAAAAAADAAATPSTRLLFITATPCRQATIEQAVDMPGAAAAFAFFTMLPPR